MISRPASFQARMPMQAKMLKDIEASVIEQRGKNVNIILYLCRSCAMRLALYYCPAWLAPYALGVAIGRKARRIK